MVNMDGDKLIYIMKKRGCSVLQLCKAIHISKAAFYRKLKGTSDFTLTEVQAIIDYLNIESPMGIFFTDKVS
mgnify:CR=1 FL=1